MAVGTEKTLTPMTLASPDDAVRALIARLEPVECEPVPLSEASGRITAQPIIADRASPPSDVSAMDGYAVRLADVSREQLPICASVLPGCPAPSLIPGAAVRIMTGAVIPDGAEAVIKREEVREDPEAIVLPPGLEVRPGQNIRRRGENLPSGAMVVHAGQPINPVVATALASFGVSRVRLYRKLRLAVVVTGDELLPVDAAAEPWQIRDSNGPALRSLLAPIPWIEFLGQINVADEFDTVLTAFRDRLEHCDVLFVTGGVSAGTHDFVPAALRQAGCDLVFHRLPQRPGGPLLGAIGSEGQAVLGLPGNPQSAMTSARRVGAAALRKRAGLDEPVERRPVVALRNADDRRLHLWWYRPVRLVGAGEAELIETKGSGDVVAAARSDGFVEVPPNVGGPGPWPFYGWGMGA